MDINFEILQYFIYKRIIKKQQAAAILSDCERLHMWVERYMLAKNYCTEVQEVEALGEFYCMPYAQLDMFDVDKTLAQQFNLNFLKKIKIVPISKDDNGVTLMAVGRPLDYNAMSMVASFCSGKIDYVLVPPVQIDVLLDSISAVISTTSALATLQSENDKDILRRANDTGNSEIEGTDDVINAPAVKLVDSIIREAIPFRASDIHIEPFEKFVKVRYRIDGDLQERADFPIESYSAICARLKIMSGLNIAERRVSQDGRINMKVNGTEYDFRVSTLPTVYGEKFVIRILDKSSFNFSRKEIGFTTPENVVVDKILSHSHGVVLLTGPTGCGKSTTLYAFLKELNTPKVNIVTVEDPVEYILNGVNQTQVNNRANMTFSVALRSILRQDPDIIMIGEIRDEETAQIAIRAAITGHLVFSTLHTNNAPGAIPRLIDMGIKDYLISDAVVGVIAQRLVKKLCPVCKKRVKTTAEEMAILGITEPANVYKPVGCQFCNNTGYKGRIAIHEIMYISDRIKSQIMRTSTVDEIRKLAVEEGMVTIFDSCRNYVFSGVTSLPELLTFYTEN